MDEYTVTWSIQLDAESMVDAARQARAIQADPHSTATIFRVTRESQDSCTVTTRSMLIDVEDPDEPIVVPNREMT